MRINYDMYLFEILLFWFRLTIDVRNVSLYYDLLPKCNIFERDVALLRFSNWLCNALTVLCLYFVQLKFYWSGNHLRVDPKIPERRTIDLFQDSSASHVARLPHENCLLFSDVRKRQWATLINDILLNPSKRPANKV